MSSEKDEVEGLCECIWFILASSVETRVKSYHDNFLTLVLVTPWILSGAFNKPDTSTNKCIQSCIARYLVLSRMPQVRLSS